MSQSIDIVVPADQEEGSTSTLASWLNVVGDAVVIHEPVAEIETDKVTVEVIAPADGILREILVEEGDEVSPGMVIGRIEVEGVSADATPSASSEEPPPATQVEPEITSGKRQIRRRGGNHEGQMSPAVKALLAEHGLNADAISGSGSGGRITRGDVLDHVASRQQPTAPNASGIPSRIVPHDGMRRKIAAHMVESLLKTAPHVTAVFEMDFSAIMAHRKAHKAAYQEKGAKLTFTAYFIAACVKAIAEVPQVNSRFHHDALEIFEDINIGIGTALGDKGLIVPVIHKTQNLDLFGIAERLTEMTQKARDGRLGAADVQKGTFTISNHGVSGSLIATPIIINQPESAILGIGKLQKRMVVIEEDGEDVACIRPMAFVTLSIDHRALDAFQTNAFLTRFVEVIEQWPKA